MEPISMLLGAMVWALVLTKVWGTARTEHELAKHGQVSPRMQAKYGPEVAAAKAAKYGFRDFLRDAWRDYWPRRTEALIAARNARAADPGGRVRLRDRFAAAAAAVTGAVRRVADHPVVRRLVDPIGPRQAADAPEPQPEPQPALAVDSGAVPEGTKRFTNTGEEEFFDGQWRPVPKAPDTFGGSAPKPAPPAGGTVTAPTGEVTNFASAIAEIDALIRLVQIQHDQAAAALRALQLVDDSIDGMQGRQKTILSATVTLGEHLTALHLDAGSLQPVMAAADVLSAGVVDTMLEHLERLRAIIQQVIASCDAALASLCTARNTLVAKYGDAAATVEENLGGDSRFLAGDNAAAPATAPLSAAN